MLWWTRFKTLFRTLQYPGVWTLPPRVLRTMWTFGQTQRPVDSPVGIVIHPYAPPIGGKSYGRYLHGLKRLARGERVPFMVHISVTNRCHYRCARCSNLQVEGAEPSVAKVRTLLSQLREAGTASVAFTGGEPTLRNDLCDLIAACGPDISPILFTSGQQINPARAQALKSAGLELVFVSLDHYQPEVHDRIRGQSGAFQKALAAIRACREAGMYTAIQAVVEPSLLVEGEMARFLDFCQEQHIHEVMLLEPIPVGPTRQHSFLPDQASAYLAEWHRRARSDIRWPKISAMSLLESKDFLGCQAGFTFFYVAANGDVYPCDLLPILVGNIYAQGVPDILATLSNCISAPSQRCLAHCLNDQVGSTLTRPMKLEGVRNLLVELCTRECPQAMNWIADPNQQGTNRYPIGRSC